MINYLKIKGVVIYFFFIVLFFPDKTIGSATFSICIKLVSEKPIKTEVYLPVNGYFQTSFPNTEFNRYFISKDSLYFNDDLSKPSFITLYFSFIDNNKFAGRCDLLIFPGDSSNIIFNPSDTAGILFIFHGSNAKAYSIFSKLNLSPAKKFAPVRELIKNYKVSGTNFFSELFHIVDSTNRPFDSLASKGIIKKDFSLLMKKYFKMAFFDNVLSHLVLYPSKQLQNISWSKRTEIGNRILKNLPISDRSVRQLYNSDLYLEVCYKFLECKRVGVQSAYELNKTNDTLVKNNKKEVIDRELTHLIYIKDYETRKNLWAIIIGGFFHVAPGYFKENVIDQYTRLFPFSGYEKLLRDALKKSRQSKDSTSFVLASPIVLTDSLGVMESIRSIITQLKDTSSNFLIDIWASWCLPCIEEFFYNKSLDTFLLKNGVKKIYISLDNSAAPKNWKAAIFKYKLGGYHILSGRKLQIEIQQLLLVKPGDPLPIPEYFIVNNKGEITKTHLRPSDEKEFMAEIISILK